MRRNLNGNTRCVRHNGNQSHGYTPGVNRCLEWSGSMEGSPVDWWEEDEEFGYSVSGGEECCILRGTDDGCLDWGPCDGYSQSSRGLSMAENKQIKRVVREQVMMLGFGNTGGPGVGFSTAIATPTSKYEQYEDYEMEEGEICEDCGEVHEGNCGVYENYSIEKGSHGHPHEMDEKPERGVGRLTKLVKKYFDFGEDYELEEGSGSGEGGTYNINISNKSADPDYTADAMGMFENILRNNIMKYKNR